MFAQEDGYVADEWDVGYYAADDVFALNVVLAAGVQFRVVCYVVVAFCEEFGIVSGGVLVLSVAELYICSYGLAEHSHIKHQVLL